MTGGTAGWNMTTHRAALDGEISAVRNGVQVQTRAATEDIVIFVLRIDIKIRRDFS
jgi:hypothetical protein